MRRLVGLAVAVAALGAAAAAQERSTVAVPRLTNVSLRRAFVLIHRAGLRVTIREPFYLASNSTPQIGRQAPKAGRSVTSGTPVVLELFQPPTVAPFATEQAIRVPKVTGLLLTYAVKRIEGAKLHYWVVNTVPALHARSARTLLGTYRVTAQAPRAGTILRQKRQVDGVEQITPVALSVRRARQRR